MKIFDKFTTLADALKKDSTFLFLEDESQYISQLMKFEVLDYIDTSHTESFYEMTPAYEELYSRFSYWVQRLISVFPEKEKVLEAMQENMLLEITQLTP